MNCLGHRLLVERVERQEQRELFKDLLARYHYLGDAMPFGARIQYLVYVSRTHFNLPRTWTSIVFTFDGEDVYGVSMSEDADEYSGL